MYTTISADVHDSHGGLDLLLQLENSSERLELIVGDKAYGGMFRELAMAAYNIQVETSQRPPSKVGFVPQKGRWQVERSFAWAGYSFYKRRRKAVEYFDLSLQIQQKLVEFIDDNKDFYTRVKKKYPELTQGDLRLCALIKLNFPSKNIIFSYASNILRRQSHLLRI